MFDEKNAAESVIEEFLKIAEIPRGSGNEKRIGEYLISWADEHNLFSHKDSVGNVIIEKEASKGFEKSPCVILQSHMDMVCVCEEKTDYDSVSDPIKVIRTSDSLTADKTSLGADDGAGMAIALYILSDDSLNHGKIRAIFTVGEETSMEGSEKLDVKWLDGGYLLNLDWEEFGSVCSSCANNVFLSLDKSYDEEKSNTKAFVKLSLSGFLGGHSGCDINLNRANAVKLTSSLVRRIKKRTGAKTVSLKGGTVKNAIPSSCECILALDNPSLADDEAKKFADEIRREFENEKDFSIRCDIVNGDFEVISDDDSILDFITAVHSGVYFMSKYTKDFVETSCNLGIADVGGGKAHIELLSRSSSKFRSEEMKASLKALASSFGFDVSIPNENPIWEEKGENELIRILKKSFLECTGETLDVIGVHAGLECAYFSTAAEKLQMASLGPQLYDVHSTKEKWDISRLPETVHFVVRTLELLGE
jgi:dipeptidase D